MTPPPPHRHHHPISARHVEYKYEEVVIGAHLINQYAGIHTTKSTKIPVIYSAVLPIWTEVFFKNKYYTVFRHKSYLNVVIVTKVSVHTPQKQ